MSSRQMSPSRRREDIRAWWREHLAAQRRSGQTQTAYCTAHGLDPTYFSAWKRKLISGTAKAAAVPKASPRSAVQFLPLVIKKAQTADTLGASSPRQITEAVPIRVTLRNGVSVVFEVGGLHTLPALLGELAQISC